MGSELPMLSAVVARLDAPEIHLAAYGGVVFPIALLIEAPIIMMLAASTALAKDLAAYRSLRRFMHRIAAGLTVCHVLLAFTPLFDLWIVRALDVPAPVIEPARLGLQIMLPWTWSIAIRRFNEGLLIRGGRSRLVSHGAALRILAGAATVTIGYLLGAPGIVVATATVIVGVTTGWLFAALKVRPLVAALDPGDPAAVVRGRAFLRFYLPLALAPLVTLVVQPIGAAAISRMPQPLESLATWPVISGLFFLLQGAGLAYSEVVVALLERPGAPPTLRRFAWILCSALIAVVLLLAATPLAGWWFGGLMGLRPELTHLAHLALWLGLPLAGARALQSWYQGVVVHARDTRAITESVLIFLLVCASVLLLGVHEGRTPGLLVALLGFSAGRLAETAWMWWRSRPTRRALGL
jgi:hypothetical protein